MNAAFYHAYRRQNPVKYKQKYGDKLPEELADSDSNPGLSAGNVQMTIKPLANVEVDFQPEPVFAPEPDVVKPKAKKGGKAKPNE